jgi:uncharacterized membrane protein YfcA
MNSLLLDFSASQLALIGLLFAWTGFVRSALGFGGAALGLPMMLFIYHQPLFWLPVIGLHLLFFSALTLRTRIDNVDWAYLRKTSRFIIPAALIGVFGLINLPTSILVKFIYAITLFYAIMWLLNLAIHSNKGWMDKLLLILGGYIAGTSLTGAPLMVAVFMRKVAAAQLRNTLFVLWFVLVSIKLTTFVVLGVSLHWQSALLLLPAAAVGHVIGLKAHDRVLSKDRLFKQVIGGVLAVISGLGLWGV